MKITLLAHTQLTGNLPTEEFQRDINASQADNLAEQAGRACYQSWSKPNPATAANRDYIRHILEVQHGSVLEHGSATFYIEGVSRSLTHELVRHRHASYSQLSQRFVVMAEQEPVIPPLFRDNPDAIKSINLFWDQVECFYEQLLGEGERTLKRKGVEGTAAKKRAREAARAVLPNMTPTAIVMSGNHRAWRELLVKRGSLGADAEIRELAIELYLQLHNIAPATYSDFQICQDQENDSYLTASLG